MKHKKTIQVFLAVLFCASILTGCSYKTEENDYYNRADPAYNWFTLGDTIYTGSVFSIRTQYRGSFDTPLVGLCRDPMCTHDDNSALCPDHIGFNTAKFYCTDGKKIYFSGMNTLTDNLKQGIYSVNPDGTAFRLLILYDWIGSYHRTLRYCDGYLYYQQSVYETSTGEEWIVLMRISTNGGVPEEVLSERFKPGIEHYVDENFYYILDTSPIYDYEQSLTLINRNTGEVTENVRPEGCGVNSVQVYQNETYIICAACIPEKNYNTVRPYTPLRVYRFHDGTFERLVENIIQYTFSDGAFWYTLFDMEYYGSIEMPTGKGNETDWMDVIRTSDNTLTRYDLANGHIKTWGFDHFDNGFTPTFYGLSDGIAIVSMGSQKLYYETKDSMGAMHKYRLNDDGTVTDLGILEP